MIQEQQLDRMLRLPDVEAVTGVKRTAIAEMIERGEFPRPVFLSDGGRAKAWLESELREWQARRVAARESAKANPQSQPPKKRRAA
jgi:prophage regulatory protein